MEKVAEALIGVCYLWWHEGMPMDTGAGPFWSANADLPPLERIQAEGCCCSGLLNLLRRADGATVAGVEDGNPYAGGVPAWADFFRHAGTLLPLTAEELPMLEDWTLLIRPYKDEEDQGHIAFIRKGGIYHCRPDKLDLSERQGLQSPGVIQDGPEAIQWAIESGYYTQKVLPSAWRSAQKVGTPTFTSSSEPPPAMDARAATPEPLLP